MKHLIKKHSSFFAGCTRLGCIASLEGGVVDIMTTKDLNDFFTSDCPSVFTSKDSSLASAPFNKRRNYLLNYAKKEIKSWKKLIKYWADKK